MKNTDKTTAKPRLNWLITWFLLFIPTASITATVLLVTFGFIHWPTWVFAFGYLIATGMAITAGYHRLFSHGAYKTIWPVRLLLLLFGAASFQGSALEWCSDHRNHHRYTDTEKDPYNSKRGFWYSHIGWLFFLDQNKRDFHNVTDLMQDPLVRFQHRYFIYIAVFMSFVLPTIIASLWGDPLGGFFIVGGLRLTLNHHFTFCINSVCHYFGKRTYSEKSSARDHWLTALVTYGEGFHNFHHQFPLDYRNGIRFFHFDPTKWFIRGLSYLGFANSLKRINSNKILQYRLRLEEKHLLERHANPTYIQQKIQPLRERIFQLMEKIEQLEKSLTELKNTRFAYMRDKISTYRAKRKDQGFNLKTTRRELERFLENWQMILSQHLGKDNS